MKKGNWHNYGVCPECGYAERIPFGDMWFLEKQLSLCPNCGTSVKKWIKKTGRRIVVKEGKHFWSRNTFGWEWKD